MATRWWLQENANWVESNGEKKTHWLLKTNLPSNMSHWLVFTMGRVALYWQVSQPIIFSCCGFLLCFSWFAPNLDFLASFGDTIVYKKVVQSKRRRDIPWMSQTVRYHCSSVRGADSSQSSTDCCVTVTFIKKQIHPTTPVTYIHKHCRLYTVLVYVDIIYYHYVSMMLLRQIWPKCL